MPDATPSLSPTAIPLPELFRKIRHIEIRSRRLSTHVFLGEYRSVFKGGGLEFMEVREYLPGDDIRAIDWNVTARMGHPYIKKFAEERELTVYLLVDLSASAWFGSVTQTKREVATEIAALLAFAAVKNNDKVGLVLFTTEVEQFVPPRKGRQHVLRLVRDLLFWTPAAPGTDIGKALAFLSRIAKKRSVAFLISDFLGDGYAAPLHVLAQKHDIIAVTLIDPRELEIPPVGLMGLEDAETGQRCLVDTTAARFQEAYRAVVVRRQEERRRLLGGMQVDEVEVVTNRSYYWPLLQLLRRRAKRA